MRPMSDPDYVYQPWSEERREQASLRARARIAREKAALEVLAQTDLGRAFFAYDEVVNDPEANRYDRIRARNALLRAIRRNLGI